MCEWKVECDRCGDGRVMERYWARQGGSVCNTNWQRRGVDKREGHRGIKWCKWYSDKFSEGWSYQMWVILDSSVYGMLNQPLRKY